MLDRSGIIAAAVARTTLGEAQRNERRVAVVRVLAYGLIGILDVVFWLLGARPPENIAESGALFVLAAALYLLVTRLPYQAWYRFAVPVVDAVMIERIILLRTLHLGLTIGFAATIALACGLFAVAGGIRGRDAAVWSTVIAGALLWRLLGAHASPTTLLYATCALLGIGFSNIWIADLVRRSLESEHGRALMARFLPRGLVERAFRDPLSVVGAPRAVEATVLISDLRGFTALAEPLPPEQVFAVLNEVQAALADAVEAHGGYVDKFMGDGMLAVFGAFEPTADSAARGFGAARAIRDAIVALNRAHPERPPLRVGIGVHTGTVVAGCLGSGDRMEFTVIGDTVNTTARLEALTKEVGTSILVSEATADRLDPGAGLVYWAEVAVRGRQRPVRVFVDRAEHDGPRP